MNTLSTLSFIVLFILLASCFSEDYDRCGAGYHFKNNECYKNEEKSKEANENEVTSNDAGDDDSPIDKDRWIGSACSCEGDLCTVAGAPTIHRGTIIGCEAVPKEWPGALLGCMRTSDNMATIEGAPDYYYAKGFCTLIAVNCTGDEGICNSANRGDFELMISCPEGTAMVTVQEDFFILSLHALIEQKLCVPLCEKNADCRIDEYDDVRDEPGQYQCLENDGVEFCYDSRNLPDDYIAEAF